MMTTWATRASLAPPAPTTTAASGWRRSWCKAERRPSVVTTVDKKNKSRENSATRLRRCGRGGGVVVGHASSRSLGGMEEAPAADDLPVNVWANSQNRHRLRRAAMLTHRPRAKQNARGDIDEVDGEDEVENVDGSSGSDDKYERMGARNLRLLTATVCLSMLSFGAATVGLVQVECSLPHRLQSEKLVSNRCRKSEKQSADAILDTSLSSHAYISSLCFQIQLVPLRHGRHRGRSPLPRAGHGAGHPHHSVQVPRRRRHAVRRSVRCSLRRAALRR
jgi:hypothetical protein